MIYFERTGFIGEKYLVVIVRMQIGAGVHAGKSGRDYIATLHSRTLTGRQKLIF